MKPILFNTEMVKAILEGRKISTRRIVKDNVLEKFVNLNWDPNENTHLAPYWVGEILYVRETWMIQSMSNFDKRIKFMYKAQGNKDLEIRHVSDEQYEKLLKYECKNGWQPSLFMPKVAARIFLKVADIKVQRLQDITEDEAQQEGTTEKFSYDDYTQKIIHSSDDNYKYGFAKVWRDCGHKWPYVWEGNPWVFVISFKRVEKGEVI